VQPRFYLSTEWGVPFGTVAVAIPFYLARVDLTRFHADRAGYVEGADRADILRYLRHEVGHVINYAYKLYEQPEWVRLFGDINADYEEEYRPRPFSREYVRHLPGWYAQKHPDEDWAETFAVWLTPGLDWRSAYADWPGAMVKLEYCDRTMTALRERDPLVTDDQPDEDVGELACTVEDFYAGMKPTATEYPIDLDDALDGFVSGAGGAVTVAEVLRRLAPDVCWQVYRWTGHVPERTHGLLDRLAGRGGERGLKCAEGDVTRIAVALTALVTALAMSHDLHA
jgi:Putative zinc-binding metallo-peptidase